MLQAILLHELNNFFDNLDNVDNLELERRLWYNKITKSPLGFNAERAFPHFSFYKFEWVMCGRDDRMTSLRS